MTVVVLSTRDIMVNAVRGDRLNEGITPALFAYAKTSSGVDAFLAGCEEAEVWIRTDAAEADKWDEPKLPRRWIEAKSNIAAGMRAGLAPVNYGNEYAMRMAKIEVNKAKKGLPSESPDKERESTPEAQGTVMLADMPVIPDDLTELIGYLATLPELSRQKEVRHLTNHAKQTAANHAKGSKKGQQHQANQSVAA